MYACIKWRNVYVFQHLDPFYGKKNKFPDVVNIYHRLVNSCGCEAWTKFLGITSDAEVINTTTIVIIIIIMIIAVVVSILECPSELCQGNCGPERVLENA